jgi:hypothetical protein
MQRPPGETFVSRHRIPACALSINNINPAETSLMDFDGHEEGMAFDVDGEEWQLRGVLSVR